MKLWSKKKKKKKKITLKWSSRTQPLLQRRYQPSPPPFLELELPSDLQQPLEMASSVAQEILQKEKVKILPPQNLALKLWLLLLPLYCSSKRSSSELWSSWPPLPVPLEQLHSHRASSPPRRWSSCLEASEFAAVNSELWWNSCLRSLKKKRRRSSKLGPKSLWWWSKILQ